MYKVWQKIMATVSLGALLIVASGFCYGMTAQAAMNEKSVKKMAKCHSAQATSNESVAIKSKTQADSILPCCVDSHEKAPSTQVPDFAGINKLVAIQALAASSNIVTFSLVNNFSASDVSPPKPDKLSSVLRLE